MRSTMGALSPYAYYSRIRPEIERLESTKGTLEYFVNYELTLPKIEPTREKYFRFLSPLLLGAAMMKIALDYYKHLGYETTDTDETETDQEYKIDVIAEKEDEVIVSQVKSGEISRQEFNEFCRKAPKFLEKYRKDKTTKKLAIVSYKLDSHANFSRIGKQLKEAGIDLEYEYPERIIDRLPKYRRHFKELKEIHD